MWERVKSICLLQVLYVGKGYEYLSVAGVVCGKGLRVSVCCWCCMWERVMSICLLQVLYVGKG